MRRAAVGPALVGLAALAVFLPSLRNGFVDWDDAKNLLDNLAYRGLGAEQLRWMWTTFHLGPYQPLSWMTYGLDYLVWGMRPLGYHLTSVLLHALSAGLLVAVVRRLVPQRGESFATLAALLWAVHPLRVEAVSWATERREVLCGAFALGALLSHLRGGRVLWTAALALAAMLSKGTAVVLPGLFVLIDLHRDVPWKTAVRRQVPLLAVSAGMAAVAVVGQRQAQALASLQEVALSDRAVLFLHNLGFYAWKTIWPACLAPLYALTGSALAVRLGAAASAGVLLAAVVLGRRRRGLLLLLAAYVVLVLPVGGLLQAGTQVAADRYAYAPGWALSLLLALGMACVVGANFRRLLACAVAAGLPLSVLAVRQQRVWHDPESLWTHQLACDPDSALAHYSLALRRVTREPGREADFWAEPHFREAVRLRPDFPDAYRGLGNVLRRTGRFDEASQVYAAGLAVAPGSGPLLYGLAIAQWETDRRSEALATLGTLAEVPPVTADSHLVLARALAAAGDVSGAVRAYERAMASPTDAPAVAPMELAWLLATYPDPRFRDGPRALELARRAARLGAELQARGGLALRAGLGPRLIRTLAAALAEVGEFEAATDVLRRGAPGFDPQEVQDLLAPLSRREPIRAQPAFP
ncbi:MAG TPA: tetratricopeptide repeat protein [Candidatus Polarisedimenticolaceae bacterium]|nr:tetratricopeptide repeat protein [Candidatus Polarisedimenticolaceae bacterium]